VNLLKRYSTAPTPPAATAAAAQPVRAAATAADQLDDLLAEVQPQQQQPRRSIQPTAAAISAAVNDDLDSLLGQLTQPKHSAPAPVVPASPPVRNAHAPDPNPPVVGLRIAPGRSQGAASHHKADVEADMWYGKTREWTAKRSPQPGFNPVMGEVIHYTFIDRDQLEADLQHLKTLQNAGEIDNATFQHQRDHMLIMARGGPQYGAIVSGSHANVKGRSKDPVAEAQFAAMIAEADRPKFHH
jgi:hypothetical protein